MATCHNDEGWRVVSRARPFDLTPCFEEGILLSALLAVVLVSGLFKTLKACLQQAQERKRTSRMVLGAKLILLLGALGLSSASAILLGLRHISVAVRQVYILEPIALASAILLTYFNHTRSRVSSTTLLLFWPAYAIALGLWLRTALSLHPFADIRILVSLKAATLACGMLSCVLECWRPEFDVPPKIDEVTGHQEHPLTTANVYSKLFFSWMTPLMRKGATEYITEEDLPALKPADESRNLGNTLAGHLARGRSLWVALFLSYGGPYAVAACLKVVQDCLNFLQPQLLRWLLAYISEYQRAVRGGQDLTDFRVALWVRQVVLGAPSDTPTEAEGFLIAIIMFVAGMAQTIILNQYFQRTFETGMRVRAGLVTAIYEKALRISNDERSRASGDIVNLMSVDATRMQELCGYGLIAISGPLQITLAFISLYNILGWSAFVGVAIMVVSLPLNTFIASILKRMQEKQMKNRDQRTRLMSELLTNIKSIKLYAWEFAFMRKILEVRNNLEMKMLKRIGIVTSLSNTLWSGIPLIVALSSFATAAAVYPKPLTADIIFPAMSLFMLLQFPLAMFAQVTSNIIEAVVSVKRLSSFLNADELQTDARVVVEKPNLQLGDEVLSIKHADFSWSKDAVQPTLEDINLTVRMGELVGVLGRVGQGKTSLLSAIVGEMTRREGEVLVNGAVAYAPQNPWILSATVRENILFNHVYEEDFYNLVVEACALKPDLALLSEGDMTEVGEKGITLSGGQRARIALARAPCCQTSFRYVLRTRSLVCVSHLADHVIGPRGILANKARILVTNSIAFISQFDHIAFIRRGIILEQGTYPELISNEESEISRLVRGHGVGHASGTSTPYVTTRASSATPTGDDSTLVEDDKRASILSEKLHREAPRSFAKATVIVPSARAASKTGLTKEHSEKGRVKLRVYQEYIKAASRWGFWLFILATILQQAASVLSTLVLRSWSEHNEEGGADANDAVWFYLGIYGASTLLTILLNFAAVLLMFVTCGMRSAKRMHDAMLDALMRAPLSFFELTPTGRVLNLFSRDTYVVDQVLPRLLGMTFRTFATCLAILVVIGVSFPPFLIAVIPLGWFYSRVMTYYLATSRELKRLDAVSRSPIFAWFSESLAGLPTIRAFRQERIFVIANQQRIDRNQMCYLPSVSVNRWLQVRLEGIGAAIIFLVALLALSALITTGVDAGLVGLVLSYALNTTSSLNWVIRSASEVEQNIVSVERIMHQIEVPSEAPYEKPENKPEDWPKAGKVEFRHYSTRYRPELDLVLKDINVVIEPKQKIGIVGRTGSGKSSLLLSLFRVIEPVEGTILIDDVDVTKIGLHDLRSNISIVPQSPDLFEGTLRENIDPVGEHQDADIWVALGQAHLKEYVESLPGKLDAPVREGGQSLSSGQRQLLCFARALLRKCKILVLDEATSAVDLDTDQAIQEIIRGPAFHDVTILTIAHRLNTIMESDRIMVMSDGRVAEIDTPQNLLAKGDSLFYSLANEAGLVDAKAKVEETKEGQ
ncbi:P-loop containing nucleoside triphosphate hydrolase protein [Schizophyllum commune]